MDSTLEIVLIYNLQILDINFKKIIMNTGIYWCKFNLVLTDLNI